MERQKVEDGKKMSIGLFRMSVDGEEREERTKQLLGLGAWKCTEWSLGAAADREVEVIDAEKVQPGEDGVLQVP